MFKANHFFGNGSGPSIGGMSLPAALAAVARVEEQLAAARTQAKAAARREGRSVSGLFAEGDFVSRATAEKWTDEARKEGWKAGHNFLSDALSRANRPPDPADPFYHLAMRLQREGNRRSLDEMLRYWARLDAAGFADATRAGDYDKAAQICVAVQREEESGKVTGERILKAAKDRRMGGPPVPEPEKGTFADRVLAAARKRDGKDREMTDRLQQLEQQAAAIIAEIAALTAGKSVPPPPALDEGARVVPLLPEPSSLPDLKQMERLYHAVVALAPWPLDDRYDPDRPFRGFCCSYRWLASKGRTEFPNPRFALGFWLDDCRAWLRDRNSMTSDVSATTLVLAVYAAGDVRFVRADPQLGTTWELALAEHSGRRASPDGWKRILREGAAAVLPPSAPARRAAPLSPTRVFVG